MIKCWNILLLEAAFLRGLILIFFFTFQIFSNFICLFLDLSLYIESARILGRKYQDNRELEFLIWNTKLISAVAMEPWFLNYIILMSPGKNKKRTSTHSNAIYFKDIFMLDLMESIKAGSPLKRTLNEFFQTDFFFFNSEQPCWLFED